MTMIKGQSDVGCIRKGFVLLDYAEGRNQKLNKPNFGPGAIL